RGRKSHGILDARVVPSFDSRVVPPVEAMAHITAVAEGHALLKDSRFRSQYQFNRPFHSVHAVYISNRRRHTAILVLSECEVDRRHRHPVMRDRKVELYAERSPCTA